MSAPLTLCEAFQASAAIDPDAIALRTPGSTQTMTWRQYAEQVRAIAAGLASLGVRRGDTVALMMSNRLEFFPIDVGAQHLGATSFSVYNTLSAEQLKYVLTNAGNNVMVCEEQYVDVIRASGVPIEHLVCVDGAPPGTIGLDELIGNGAADFDFEATWREVSPDDVLTLIYTSGTTGNPKGVEITHTSVLHGVTALAGLADMRYGDRMLSFLPSAHIGDRFTALYSQARYGTAITVVSDFRRVAEALPDARPTVFGSVPRVWEKMKAGIEAKVAGEPSPVRRKVAQWAFAQAAKKGEAALDHRSLNPRDAVQHAIADRLVLSGVRKLLGLDCMRLAVSASAPISADVLAFFTGMGVDISEMWGMSEVGAMATATRSGESRLGSVGKLIPGMEYRLADDGEMLLRGPLLMKGYRGEPTKTAEAIDADGWLHTGDIMTVDDDGYFRIIDRKKDLIINSNGKNMSPANIENAIKAACPEAGAVVAIGDRRSYNTALVVLDAESGDRPAEALAADPAVVERIAAGIANANAKLSHVEQIKRFTILPAFWEPGGDELTMTLKVRRKPVADKYAALIDAMYIDTPGPSVHQPRK